MKLIEVSFTTPEKNLACDEALLHEAESGQGAEALRFWESDRYFVVVGYSNKVHSETRLRECRRDGVPVLRRVTGGGAVLQGPGCLNYSLILENGIRPDFGTIAGTNGRVMERHCRALQALLKKDIRVEGFTDLALGNLKFSGNSQRRKRRYLLFHGTFLLKLDLGLVEKYLPLPTHPPAYRLRRSHREFLTNLNIEPSAIQKALQAAWGADEPYKKIPHALIERLACEVYSTDSWNFKR